MSEQYIDNVLQKSESESTIEAKVISVESLTEETNEQSHVDDIQEDSHPRLINPNQAELEVTIKELRETLRTTQRNESVLRQQVIDLQATLPNQQELTNLRQQVVDLQTAFYNQQELTEKLRKELSEAKQTALELADANSKLTEEMKTLQPKTLQPKKDKPQALSHQKSIYQKSHRAIEKPVPKPVSQETKEVEDNSGPMWLLD